MRIFSFDSGNKNLGVAVVDIADWRTELTNIRNTMILDVADAARRIESLIDNLVTIVWACTVDLCGPGEKLRTCDKIKKAGRLKHLLMDLDLRYGPVDKIVLEDQMHSNFYSNEVNAQIMYHYATDSASDHVIIVSGRLKNGIILVDRNVHDQLKAKYSGRGARYRFNKVMARANYGQFRADHGLPAVKSKADEADAFMMAYAFALIES